MNDDEPNVASFVRLKLPNVRHQMWNGRWHAAIALEDDLSGYTRCHEVFGYHSGRAPDAISQTSAGSAR